MASSSVLKLNSGTMGPRLLLAEFGVHDAIFFLTERLFRNQSRIFVWSIDDGGGLGRVKISIKVQWLSYGEVPDASLQE